MIDKLTAKLTKYDKQAGEAKPHESAHLHVTGEANYIDDIAELAQTHYLAPILSSQAHAEIRSISLDAVWPSAGVVDVLLAKDIKGENNCGAIIHDEPIFADDKVQYIGQMIGIVVAKTVDQARKAARKAIVEYNPLPALLCPKQARQQNQSVVAEMNRVQGQPKAALEQAKHRLQGEFAVGGQEQFYLEGQISYAIPQEDNTLLVHCSTQHPSEMQHLIAHALGWANNQVTVEIRRMGGGFGGKESQSAMFACAAALAADKLKLPIKFRADRDDDMLITGKRHDFSYHYDVGFDDNGLINGISIDMTSRAGFAADLSAPVATRALCHADNAYYLEHADINVFSAKTNTQSNTAFRGFGGPQGAIIIEQIIDSIAYTLGLDALAVRKTNFYGINERNITPYDQVVEDNVIHEMVAELEASSNYQQRRQAIIQYNKTSPILKKGIALTPLKFGISFNLKHLNQAGALVHIYTDGSVLVNHGGTEMGQGLHSKIAQIVADELGIDSQHVRSTATNTSKVANTSATAASSGTDLNGKAAQQAVQQIKARLIAFIVEQYQAQADAIVFADNTVYFSSTRINFSDLIQQAYVARVQLWSDGFYATPKIHWDAETLSGKPFFYFAYGAAVSEVAIDTLTGEMKLLRADLLHDAGNSINPALDIGQVEGAYIQGMGWLTCEELCWNEQGKLTTHAPSTYKIPAINDCPTEFNTQLFHNPNIEDTIRRSKAVGEPPLLLGMSAFFAIRDAIASTVDYTVAPPLNAPATAEEIMQAIDRTSLLTKQSHRV